MKKALAMLMAIAMIASLAAVSFAAVSFTPTAKEDDPDATKITTVDAALYDYNTTAKKFVTNTTGEYEFGDKVYLVIRDDDGFATEEKTVSGLSLKAEWNEGGEYVESVEIVKKKHGTDGNVYAIEIATTGSDNAVKTVSGTISLKGRSGVAKPNKVDAHIDLDFTVGYAQVTKANVPADKVEFPADKTVYDFVDVDNDEYELYYGPFSVTANFENEKKVLLAVDDEVIEEIEEAYPDAAIDYYAFTGSFKKTAEVVVDLDEVYLYEVVDGVVTEVNGEYDDWSEEFTFKTRKMGTYILSDVELELAADVVVTNPSTGAAA